MTEEKLGMNVYINYSNMLDHFSLLDRNSNITSKGVHHKTLIQVYSQPASLA